MNYAYKVLKACHIIWYVLMIIDVWNIVKCFIRFHGDVAVKFPASSSSSSALRGPANTEAMAPAPRGRFGGPRNWSMKRRPTNSCSPYKAQFTCTSHNTNIHCDIYKHNYTILNKHILSQNSQSLFHNVHVLFQNLFSWTCTSTVFPLNILESYSKCSDMFEANECVS